MLHHLLGKQDHGPLGYAVYFFVFATPLFEIPQAYNIYVNRSAAGVSLLTWTCFFLSSLTWLTYGFRHRIKPIIMTYSLYLVVEATIVTGILLYH